MRRHLSIASLAFAWLCANGALWNVVQVVAWARMFHGYVATTSVGSALEQTFDGSKPCALCRVSQAAEDTARHQAPREAALGAGDERLLLAADAAPAIVVTAPDSSWSIAGPAAGPTRTDTVPVPPPRA